MNIKVKHLIFFSVLATVVVDTLVFYTFLLVTFFFQVKDILSYCLPMLRKKSYHLFMESPKEDLSKDWPQEIFQFS